MEADCAALIVELNVDTISKSAIAGTVVDIKRLWGAQPDIRYLKVNQSGNSAAHVLAKLGRNVVGMQMMFGYAPFCVLDLTKLE